MQRLTKNHFQFLLLQLNPCAAKWREIGTHLRFKQQELKTIQAESHLLNEAPESWLSAMLDQWLDWAPGDYRGSTNFATLEDLKVALHRAGFGAVAEDLTLPGIQTGESYAVMF